jgi:hypothetical protein
MKRKFRNRKGNRGSIQDSFQGLIHERKLAMNQLFHRVLEEYCSVYEVIGMENIRLRMDSVRA